MVENILDKAVALSSSKQQEELKHFIQVMEEN